MCAKGFIRAISDNIPAVDSFKVTVFLKKSFSLMQVKFEGLNHQGGFYKYSEFNIHMNQINLFFKASRESYVEKALGHIKLKSEGRLYVIDTLRYLGRKFAHKPRMRSSMSVCLNVKFSI